MNTRNVKYQSSFSQLPHYGAGRDTRTERANSRGEKPSGCQNKVYDSPSVFLLSQSQHFSCCMQGGK